MRLEREAVKKNARLARFTTVLATEIKKCVSGCLEPIQTSRWTGNTWRYNVPVTLARNDCRIDDIEVSGVDQLRVARGVGVALRLQSLLRFAGMPLVETSLTAGVLARLQLLAAPALVRPDATIVPLERKDAALLALLAFDGPTSRSRAAALLWPDADADKGRNSLRQRLFRLRRAAGTELIEPEKSLRLADRVEHNLGSPARQLANDPTAAAGDLLGACGYEDCPEVEDWVRIAREHWRAMRRDALAELAAKREADGQIAQALVYAERLLAEDPVSEQAHRLAMRLHYRRGDRAAALAAYDRCRSALQRELAAAPDEGGAERVRAGSRLRAQWPRAGHRTDRRGALDDVRRRSVAASAVREEGLAHMLKGQFSPATLIEQLGRDCRTKTPAGSARVYRVTLPAKQPLFMRLELVTPMERPRAARGSRSRLTTPLCVRYRRRPHYAIQSRLQDGSRDRLRAED